MLESEGIEILFHFVVLSLINSEIAYIFFHVYQFF